MKKITLLMVVALLLISFAKAQEEPRPYIKKGFCIILSTKSYTEAKKVAEKAAKQLNIQTDYRDLLVNKKIGLTMSEKDCTDNGFDFPAYIARGKDDDGEYISIEYSNAFGGFANGYYIVVVSSGEKETTAATLKKVKKWYKTAYIKQSEVYIGCMH
jgi:hypothetical protein